jgi:hypothetical protein
LTSIENINIYKLIGKKLRTPSVFAVLTIILFTLFTFKYWISWPVHPFLMDVDQYYSYLVAQFIHHDLSFSFPHQYWLIGAQNHHMVPKVTMGIAILNLPFFVIADNIAYAFDFDPLGYSAPYSWCIHFGAIFYVVIGFWYLRKSLLLFFSEWVVAISLVVILFGTNLFYYAFKETEMSHSYLFFLFSIFIYHTIKWHFTKENKHLYYLSFIAGFIALIRPTEVLVLLIPLLYQVTSIQKLREKILLIVNLKWKLLLVVFLFLIPIIPQLIFWKTNTGQFFFFSYGSSEGFFFADPKLYSVLFGWRKGWFIYTPLMIFVVFGLVFMFKKWKSMFIPVVAYLFLNLYLISSWWDWGFGGAHGMRALVQCYAFLVFPLAFFVNWLFQINKMWIKLISISLCFSAFSFFIYLNIYQTWLFKNSLMHWDSMTKEAYCYTFLTADVDRVYLETLFKHPNYEELRKGIRDE